MGQFSQLKYSLHYTCMGGELVSCIRITCLKSILLTRHSWIDDCREKVFFRRSLRVLFVFFGLTSEILLFFFRIRGTCKQNIQWQNVSVGLSICIFLMFAFWSITPCVYLNLSKAICCSSWRAFLEIPEMAFRARNVFGTFEKWVPELLKLS